LKNPSENGSVPEPGKAQQSPDLNVGRKINIPGPQSFALWPGQMVEVLKGHHLRSNQFIVGEVYDAKAAKENWHDAVVVVKEGGKDGETTTTAPDFLTGERFIIKGTDISFYIPPTGVNIKLHSGEYVRDAVTLERQEYCVLLGESGKKRYVEGPDVVFPSPTEQFMKGSSGSRKFKAIDLNVNCGLYIRVIAPYTEGKGDSIVEYKVGEELFITGKEQMVYFPREEHGIVKYGEEEIHHAVAIPKGEARYVMNRTSGEIAVIKGPKMHLADPRTHVDVRRILDPTVAGLWFPTSPDAVEYNTALLESQLEADPSNKGFMNEQMFQSTKTKSQMSKKMSAYYGDRSISGLDNFAVAGAATSRHEIASGKPMADTIREKRFTPPRMITLDTKYEGAIPIDVWTGYAVLVVGKSGSREVVVGPKRRILEYDESLEPIKLSSGTPKGSRPTKTDVYLRVKHNKISDMIEVITKDLVTVNIVVSYRVNFTNLDKAFDVEDYIKFLTDHLRSLLKGIVKGIGIEAFNDNYTAIIRDSILGQSKDGERTGRMFEENGMNVYDVDIQEIKIGDEEIEHLLINNQTKTVEQTLNLKEKLREQEFNKTTNEISRSIQKENHTTILAGIELSSAETDKRSEVDAKNHKIDSARENEKLALQKITDKIKDAIEAAKLVRDKNDKDQKALYSDADQKRDVELIVAQTEAFVKKGAIYSNELVQALTGMVQLGLTEKVTAAFSQDALRRGKSAAEIMDDLLGDLPMFEEVKKKLITITNSGTDGR